MVKKIALFNHKGGVSKTTTTFNIGWKLAEKNKRVLIVDADPQCNLTGMTLGYSGLTDFEQFYEKNKNGNLMAGLSPTFEAKLRPIEAVECFEKPDRKNLFLLPGHVRLAEYDLSLGIAQELSGSIGAMKNLPGSINALMNKTAEKYSFDYILFDMSPSLSAINQNILMTSDYFLVPCAPDFFSVMAIDSLARILDKWSIWARKAEENEILKNADYPFPETKLKIIGTVIQKYKPRNKQPAGAFQEWINKINNAMKSKLKPELEKNNMLLPKEKYASAGVEDNLCLELIPDFNVLIAKSQEYQKATFALSPEEIGTVGVVADNQEESRAYFDKIFSSLADKVIKLTE